VRLSRHSIQVKLTLAVAGVVAGLGSAFALSSYVWLGSNLENELEAFALHEIDEVAAVVAGATTLDDAVRLDALGQLLPEEGVLSLEVWSLDGSRAYPPPGEPAPAPALPLEALAAARSGRPVFDDVRPDGGTAGLRALRLVQYGREPRWLVTATVSRSRADDALARFARFSAAGVLAATLLVAAGGLALLSRALRPMQDLVADAVILAREGGRGRLREPPRGSELGELARLLNRLLAQTEQSLARLRRFTADAGHELRTPLTRIRGEVDSALAASDLATAREALARVLEELDSLRQVIDGLLDLAQGEEPVLDAEPPIELSDLVEEVVGEAALVGSERGVRIELERPPRALARGSRALLARVLWNLIDNAIRASAPGGRVRVRLARLAGGQVAIDVEDDGPGLDPGADRDTLFEPFVQARAGAGGGDGLGLGLALSRAIARRHAGDLLWLEPDSLPGARLRLLLPAVEEPIGARSA
jgi:signal transduction histidine kinase